MRDLERTLVEGANSALADGLADADVDLFAQAEGAQVLLKQALALPPEQHAVMDCFDAGVIAERTRILLILAEAPRAALDDGRNLVVRTDVIRKVESPIEQARLVRP